MIERGLIPEAVQEKVQQVLSLAMRIRPRQADVFADFSPHVSSLSVGVFLVSWTNEGSADEVYNIYLDEEDALEELDSLIKRLMLLNPGGAA